MFTQAPLIKLIRSCECSDSLKIRPKVSLIKVSKINSHFLKFDPSDFPKAIEQISGRAGSGTDKFLISFSWLVLIMPHQLLAHQINSLSGTVGKIKGAPYSFTLQIKLDLMPNPSIVGRIEIPSSCSMKWC